MFNISNLVSAASGAKAMIPSIAKNFDPSMARLAASGLIKGGASSAISGISSAIGNSAGGALGRALGGPLGGLIGGQIGNSISGSISGALNNSLNKALGSMPGMPSMPNIQFGQGGGESGDAVNSTADSTDYDWRIRVRCPVFNNATVIFPVLPAVSLNYSARYSPQNLTHSNYAAFFYESSEIQAIQISGDFPVQTEPEGAVLLDAIKFFRATTRMFFGGSDNAGNPPPLVILSGYGKYYLDNVTCIVTSFSHTMPGDVDYIDCYGTRLPTFSQIQVTLQPIVSRSKAGQFNLNAYANGWQEGFI